MKLAMIGRFGLLQDTLKLLDNYEKKVHETNVSNSNPSPQIFNRGFSWAILVWMAPLKEITGMKTNKGHMRSEWRRRVSDHEYRIEWPECPVVLTRKI